MAAEDVALALIALGDPEVRDRVRAGDLDALGELSLTDEEREMLAEAAQGDPDVTGFAYAPSQMAGADVASLRLQMSKEKQSVQYATMSNMMKKIGGTQEDITENMK